MNNKIKILIAVVGILLFIAGIFWFSTQTQNTKPQVTQNRAASTGGSFRCVWETTDSIQHTFETELVDIAGNVIMKHDVTSDATGPLNRHEYTFTNIPRENFFAFKCQVRLKDPNCQTFYSSEIDPCTPTPPTGTVTATMTPTETPTGTLTQTPTATPGDTSTKGGTGTPTATATPRAGTGTATPRAATATGTSTSTGGGSGGGAATGVPTAVSTAAAATGVAATATKAATNGVTSGATNTTAQSSTSLPASGTVHPAIILGILSLFIIALGLVF